MHSDIRSMYELILPDFKDITSWSRLMRPPVTQKMESNNRIIRDNKAAGLGFGGVTMSISDQEGIDLCQILRPHLSNKILSEEKILVTLWLLGNQESFRCVGDRFNLSKSSLHKVFLEVACALNLVMENIIVWPARDQINTFTEQCFRKTGFPGVVGAIDGTHIQIPGPKENKDSYVNRKMFTSIQLQAVCDCNLRFLDIYSGWAGVVIERAFGLLKCKFRRLKCLDMTRVDKMPLIITAACVLHNFILFRENLDIQTELQDIVFEPEPEVIYEGVPEVEREEAIANEIANLLA
nr:uncharacterized protein LOC113808677 [Penaeus vannamei]